MRLSCATGFLSLALCGCAASSSLLPADVPVHTLTLRWQRLVDASDNTCPRCASTEQEVEKAFAHLKQSLAPAGIAVELDAERLDQAAFSAAPLESNRIWLDGRPLEDWLGAQTGSSPCCRSCGDLDCRTVEMQGKSYEAVPAALIVRAGLLAAAEALRNAAIRTE